MWGAIRTANSGKARLLAQTNKRTYEGMVTVLQEHGQKLKDIRSSALKRFFFGSSSFSAETHFRDKRIRALNRPCGGALADKQNISETKRNEHGNRQL